MLADTDVSIYIVLTASKLNKYYVIITLKNCYAKIKTFYNLHNNN